MFDTTIRPLKKPPDAETETAQRIAENTWPQNARDHNYATRTLYVAVCSSWVGRCAAAESGQSHPLRAQTIFCADDSI
eukprot:956604-Prymnesium_polylepis.1